MEKLVEFSNDSADGYQIPNSFGTEHKLYGKGGLSGPRIRDLAVESVRMLREMTDKPIIAAGVGTEKDSYALLKAGANAFVVFTGFVYRHEKNPYAGPRFAHVINEKHFEMVRGEL